MSEAVAEVEQEPAGAPESPEQPEEGLEDGEGFQTPPEPAEEPGGPSEPGVPGAEPEPEARVRSEKEIEAIYSKMASERARHFDRVAVILSDDYAQMAPCPLCSHFGAGLVGLADLPADAIPTIRALLGMPDFSDLKEDAAVKVCPRCDGKGDLRTGSFVANNVTRTCGDCNGVGYVNREGAAVATAETNGEPPAVTGPTVYEEEAADPTIKRLRERGYTVIPPMRAPSA